MALPDQDIDDFLTNYQSGLSDFDSRASAELWGTPGMLLSDEFVGVLDDRAEMAAGLESGYPFYRALGLDRVEHTMHRVEWMGERVAHVHLTWHFYAGEERLVDGEYHYILRVDDDGPHMYVGVSIDEMPKLRDLARERGVAFPGDEVSPSSS